MIRQSLTAAMALAFAWGDQTRAGTIHVYPGDSIQTAINAATDADEIVVHPGTYTERIDLQGKAIVLRSLSGPQLTTIDGQQGGTVVTFHAGEGPDTVLEGFTIRGGAGSYEGGGILVSSCSPTLRDCIVRDNEAQYGGGIFVYCDSPSVMRCTFENNTAGASAGALYNYGLPGQMGGAVVTDCTFSNNEAQNNGGAARNWDSNPIFVRCTFYANISRYAGAGVANGGMSAPVFTDCIFDFNRTDTFFGLWDCYGGGVANTDTVHPVFVNCVFTYNQAYSQLPHVSFGGAVYSGGDAAPTLLNCTLVANYANLGHALANQNAGSPTVRSSILWDAGSEISHQGTGTLVITYSDVQGSWPGVGNIDLDPQFDGLRLSPSSPCKDAGDPNYDPPGGRDLDGHARVLCGRVDMGAYESGIGDYDCDYDLDALDFTSGLACLTGPDNGPYAAGCEALDFEYDFDVDLADYAAFQGLVGDATRLPARR
jgi:hypothetical protein